MKVRHSIIAGAMLKEIGVPLRRSDSQLCLNANLANLIRELPTSSQLSPNSPTPSPAIGRPEDAT